MLSMLVYILYALYILVKSLNTVLSQWHVVKCEEKKTEQLLWNWNWYQRSIYSLVQWIMYASHVLNMIFSVKSYKWKRHISVQCIDSFFLLSNAVPKQRCLEATAPYEVKCSIPALQKWPNSWIYSFTSMVDRWDSRERETTDFFFSKISC